MTGPSRNTDLRAALEREHALLGEAVARAEQWKKLGADLHAVVETMLDRDGLQGRPTTAAYLWGQAWAASNAWNDALVAERDHDV